MINKQKVLGIVPARSGSKGLKNKNVLNFKGHPLLTWPLRALKENKIVDKVLVSTDSEEYQKLALEYGAEAPFLRPKRISSSSASTFDVLEHAIKFYQKQNQYFEYIVMLEPTSPLTTSEDISDCLKLLHRKRKNADALISVGKLIDTHPSFSIKIDKNSFMNPYVGFKKFSALRRQELEDLYFLDGSIYISKIETLLKKRSFHHERTIAKEMPKFKNIEIDSIEDFHIAEYLSKKFL